MKRSKNYYLKRLTHLVEKRIENRDYKIAMMTPDTASGIIEIFDEYLFYLWINVGDTSFNRLGYRNATDDLLEQLKEHI